MRKKQKTKQKQLQNYKIAQEVTICIPSLNHSQINFPLVLCYIKNNLLQKNIQLNKKFSIMLMGDLQQCLIIKILPAFQSNDIIKVTNKTTINLVDASNMNNNKNQNNQYTIKNSINQEIYGMQKQKVQLKKSILKSIYDKNKLETYGLSRIKGILILGTNGMGKTLLIKSMKTYLKEISFKIYQSFNLLSRVMGGSQQFVKKIFQQARNAKPCVIVFEDLHLLFQVKKSEHETTLSALLTQMENIREQQQILVVGTSNLDKQLDPSIKRTGRFQKQIVLDLPKHKDREEIIKGLLSKIPNSLSSSDVHQINLKINGFSNGQIKQLLRQAFLMDQNTLTKKNVDISLKNFRPSGIKQLLTQVPQVKWNEIGGYQDVKLQIKKVIEWPLQYPEKYKNLGIEPMKGILLYGPPGCSKTMMAKAIATESKLNFLAVKGPQLFSKYVGESEKAVRNIFKRARACSPCVIFFDQIDALATQRSINTDVSQRVLCQLLNEMDGIEGLKQVTIVAATNRPNILDKALMRPGRFDHLIYIPPPDYEARKQIFRINLKKMPLEEDIQKVCSILANETNCYSGAQICLICRQAALLALSDNMDTCRIQTKYFLKAKGKMKNRISEQMIQQYRNYANNLKFF